MGSTISLARSTRELESVYRFRYEVYVEEMGRAQKDADHVRKLIRDELDCRPCNVFQALEEDKIVGTVRTNYLSQGALGLYEELYQLPDAQEDRMRVSVTTRLMIRPQLRGSPLAVRLARSTYAQALSDGILYDFIDCNDHLVPFFCGLGYRVTRQTQHPDYGMVYVMKIFTRDEALFEAVRSPFLSILRRSRKASQSFQTLPTKGVAI